MSYITAEDSISESGVLSLRIYMNDSFGGMESIGTVPPKITYR